MPFNANSASTLADPDDEMLTCALPNCGRRVRKGDAHNLGHAYLHAAGAQPPRMCREVEHFTCCHDHAVEMAQRCLNEHEHAPWDGIAETDRWRHPALAGAFTCEHADCTASVNGADSHCIAVVYRMPGPGFASHMLGIYAGCSETHAKHAAAAGMRDHSPAARHHSRRLLSQAERTAAAQDYDRLAAEAEASNLPTPDLTAFLDNYRRRLAAQ